MIAPFEVPIDTAIEEQVDALYANARSFNANAIALAVTKESNEKLWIAARNRTIGSSTAAGALGVSRYETPHKAWLEITGQIDRKDISRKAAVIAGNRLESVVRDWFAEETNRRVEVVNAILVSKPHPFLHACPDGRVVGESAGLECKTAGHWAGLSEEWGPSGSSQSDAVPLPYLVQCVVSMIVTGYRTWYLAVLIGGNDFRWYTIRYDAELAAMVIEKLRAFHENILKTKRCLAAQIEIPKHLVPPSTTMEDVFRKFPVSEPKPINATIAIANLVDDYAKLNRVVKAGEKRLEEIKIFVADYMGENDTLTYDEISILTFKSTKSKETFDSKQHSADVPACHAKYAGESKPSRSFLVKEAGGK